MPRKENAVSITHDKKVSRQVHTDARQVARADAARVTSIAMVRQGRRHYLPETVLSTKLAAGIRAIPQKVVADRSEKAAKQRHGSSTPG